jgi:hypothetical protein
LTGAAGVADCVVADCVVAVEVVTAGVTAAGVTAVEASATVTGTTGRDGAEVAKRSVAVTWDAASVASAAFTLALTFTIADIATVAPRSAGAANKDFQIVFDIIAFTLTPYYKRIDVQIAIKAQERELYHANSTHLPAVLEV